MRVGSERIKLYDESLSLFQRAQKRYPVKSAGELFDIMLLETDVLKQLEAYFQNRKK